MKNEMHKVCTFNQSGKMAYEDTFKDKWEAYKAFCEIAEAMQNTLPKGYTLTVVRYNGECAMNRITIEGIK